jgi:hypothetical protein
VETGTSGGNSKKGQRRDSKKRDGGTVWVCSVTTVKPFDPLCFSEAGSGRCLGLSMIEVISRNEVDSWGLQESA